ncbi:MAG: GNAT family N-acetyltransferase [Paracoccaceae bacterium]
MENKVLKSLADEFSNIHLKSFNQQNLRFSSRFIFSLLINPQISYIYKKNKGFCIFSINKEDAEIITMAIIPKYQNQGIGFLILNQLEEVLLKSNCNKIFLDVASNNLVALHLYKKAGFKKFGTRKNYYTILKDKKIDAILMEKFLS